MKSPREETKSPPARDDSERLARTGIGATRRTLARRPLQRSSLEPEGLSPSQFEAPGSTRQNFGERRPMRTRRRMMYSVSAEPATARTRRAKNSLLIIMSGTSAGVPETLSLRVPQFCNALIGRASPGDAPSVLSLTTRLARKFVTRVRNCHCIRGVIGSRQLCNAISVAHCFTARLVRVGPIKVHLTSIRFRWRRPSATVARGGSRWPSDKRSEASWAGCCSC